MNCLPTARSPISSLPRSGASNPSTTPNSPYRDPFPHNTMVHLTAYLGLAGLAATALAHPGGDVRAEFRAREEHLNNPQRRTLGSCRRSLEASGHFDGEHDRRMEKIGNIRRDLGLANPSGPVPARREVRAECVLDPEVTEGPYCRRLSFP